MSFFKKECCFFKKRKHEFGESPNSLQTQKNMRAQLVSKKHAATQKKIVHAYFFEFGESLEILQTHFSLFFRKKKQIV